MRTARGGARGLIPRLSRDTWIVLAVDAVSAVGSGMTVPFLVVYLHQVRGVSLEMAAVALASIALASFVGNPMGGALADRIGARTTLMLGLMASALGTGALGFMVSEGWHGVGAALVLGLGAAVAWPALDALLARVAGRQDRAAAFGLRHAVLNAGLGAGALVAATIVDFDRPSTFELIFAVDAVSYLVAILVLFLLRPPSPGGVEQREEGGPTGYLALLREPVFRRVWLLMAALVAVGYGSFHAVLPVVATGAGALPASALSIVYAANTLGVVVLQLFVLRLIQRRSRTQMTALVALSWAATWGMVLIGTHLGGGVRGTAIFVLAAVTFALGETLLSPTMPAIANDLAPEDQRGRYNGAFALAWTTGFFAGPLLAGPGLSSGETDLYLVFLVVTCLVTASAAARLRRRLPATVDHPDAVD